MMTNSGYFKSTSIVEYSCNEGITDWGWLDRYPHSLHKIVPIPSSLCSKTKTIACMASSEVITCHNSATKSVQTIQLKKSTITCLAAPAEPLHGVTFGVQRFKLIPILCAGLKNGQIEIWHGDSTKLLTRLISHSGPVLGISFILKPYSNNIVSISQDRTAKVWESEENGFNMCQTIDFPSVIISLAISVCEKMIALGGLNQKLSIYRRDPSKNRIIPTSVKHLKYHAHNISALKFYPDGALLVSGSWDGKIILWDTHTGNVKQLLSLQLPPLPQYVFAIQILSLDINRFGSGICTLSDEGRLNLWNPLDFEDDNKNLLNTSPIDETLLGDDKICRSCQFVDGETAILVPNLTSANARMISVAFTAPKLKHLTRLEIRKSVPDPEKLNSLRLPRSLISFLRYDIWL